MIITSAEGQQLVVSGEYSYGDGLRYASGMLASNGDLQRLIAATAGNPNGEVAYSTVGQALVPYGGGPQYSWLSTIGGLIGKAIPKIGTVIGGALGFPMGAQPTPPIVTGGIGGGIIKALPRLPGLPKIGGAIGGAIARGVGKRGLPKMAKNIALQLGYIIVGSLIYDAAGNLVGETGGSRKMNVMNVKALGRADRRLCGFSSKARPILRQLGFQVSTTRKAKSCRPGKKKACR